MHHHFEIDYEFTIKQRRSGLFGCGAIPYLYSIQYNLYLHIDRIHVIIQIIVEIVPSSFDGIISSSTIDSWVLM